MRLIDADKVIEDLKAMQRQYDAIALDGLIRGVEKQPTIDAEPVRHGRWTFPWTSPECSVCRKTQKWTSKYCPNCGAKMDGGEEE